MDGCLYGVRAHLFPEISSFLVCSVAAYVLFLLCDSSILQGVAVSKSYVITLSILSGVFAFLDKLLQREGLFEPDAKG
ncbi:DUF5823 family protein [Paenibacillus donghaensis]|uniref:DUF5823 family protein n=1 Tax=Paenibacillus donghaensis TaxID=414771 RepID=UPI003182FFFD